LRLPPSQLGWDVGTFEFLSDNLTSTFTGTGKGKIKLKMRTGGSSATVKREQCAAEEDIVRWDISGITNHPRPRLPVRYRYRSPVFIEFHLPGKRHAEHFAALWLQGLVDNEEQDFDVPIWKCDNAMRLSQNYITEENFHAIPDIKLEEVGRLRFRGRFKAGTDRDHLRFVSDNNSRETIETWEACFAEGVRQEEVSNELPPTIQKLHDESLTQARDVLATASPEEKKNWLAKDGTDWSGAFGQDPAELMIGEQRSDDAEEYESDSDSEHVDAPAQGINHQESDLGIKDATTSGAAHEDDIKRTRTASTGGPGSSDSGVSVQSRSSKNPIAQYKDYKSRSRDLHRQHRGLMQWRPMRNVQFVKDEAKFAVRRLTKVGSLSGRQPDVESEI
jgi:hypothetical protein